MNIKRLFTGLVQLLVEAVNRNLATKNNFARYQWQPGLSPTYE